MLRRSISLVYSCINSVRLGMSMQSLIEELRAPRVRSEAHIKSDIAATMTIQSTLSNGLLLLVHACILF
jgi:hypothetical protein